MRNFRKAISALSVVAILSSLVVSTAFAGTFNDVAEDDYYYDAIEALVEAAVVDAADDYNPTTVLNRAEAVKLVVTAAGLTADLPSESSFSDVDEDAWDGKMWEYIEIAYMNGVVNGYSEDGELTGKYGPGDDLTRSQYAKMVVEAFGLPVDMDEDSSSFDDVDDWAVPYVATAVSYGIVNGYDDDTFGPDDNVIRGDAALMTHRGIEAPDEPIVEDDDDDDVVYEGDLEVELSSDSPDGATVPSSATSVEVAMWDFTAGDGDVELDSLAVHTYGITNLPNTHALYLYDGTNRLTSGKSVNSSTNLATFNNLNLEIEEGETLTLTLRIDIGDAGTTTREMAFELEEVDAVDAGDAEVSGDFPIQADTFGISTTDAGTLTIEKNGTITSPKVGEDGVVIAKFKMSAATEAAELEQINLLVTGTISNDAIENFELYVSGESDPIAEVESLNSKDLAAFVLDEPFDISKGDTKSFTMKADFNTGRTDDTVKVYIDETTDIVAIGGTYGYGMAVTITGSTGYDGTTTACTSASGTCSYSALEGGDITITSSGPAATDVGIAADDVVLQDFTISSVADVTFKNFPIALTASEAEATEGLLNSTASNFTDIKVIDTDTGETLMGPIDADVLTTALGGSTAITEASGDASIAYYLFTDEFEMGAGDELNLSLTADVANTATLDAMTIYATLDLGNTSNTYPQIKDVNNKTVTNTSSLVPTADIVGKTMTVGSPSLVLSLAAVPVTGSTTHVMGESEVQIVGVSAKCGAASACKVTDIAATGGMDEDGGTTFATSGSDNSVNLNSIFGSVWLEDADGEEVAASKAVQSDGTVTWANLDWELDAGETGIFYFVGNISTNAYANSDAESVSFAIASGGASFEDDDGNSRTSTGTPNSAYGTYVLTSGGGSITVAVDSATPNEDIVVAGTADQEISKFKFTTTDEAFLIKKLSVNARQANAGTIADIDDADLGAYDNNVQSVTISYTNSDGDTETKTGYLTNGTAEFSGMDFYIDKDDDATLTVYATLNTVAGGAAVTEYIDLNLAFNNFDSIAQSSGETYKADKLDAGVAAASDLDFGTITYIDNGAAFEVDDADFAVTGPTLGTSISLTIDDAAGADAGLALPVGTVVCIDEANNNTTCAENVAIVTGYTDGSLDDTYSMFVVDDAGGAFADNSDIAWALPGTAYLVNAKQMHVYKSVPTLSLASSSPSGSRTVAPDDTVFTFDLAANAGEDIIIRQGFAHDDENDPVEDTMDDAEAVISTTIGEYVDGSGGLVYTAATIADDDCFLFDEAHTAGDLANYTYMSFWIKATGGMSWDSFEVIGDDNSACASGGDDQVAASATTLWVNGTATAGTGIIPTTWTFATVAISGLDTTNNTYLGFTVDTAGGTTDPVNTDVFYIDGVVLHNEMLRVDLAGNAVFDTTPANAVDCTLKNGSTTVADSAAAVISTSSGAVAIVPNDNITGTDYADIEIAKGDTETFSLVCDTQSLITQSSNDDLLTPSIDFGSATSGTQTRGDFWWSANETTRTLVYWLGDVGTKLSGNTLKY
jgi:hypothetical protein